MDKKLNIKNNIIEIDLVYLWVNGNDPKWQTKRNAFLGIVEENSEINCKGRYTDNDELKYSLRSVEKYAPWIRKIFIVTDSQTPEWLDTNNPKVKIIDHKDILPKESLPCFNSSLIEHFLYKIPDLSEHFLFANDDMFFNKTVAPETFFAHDDLPIIRLNRKLFRKFRWFFREKIRKKPHLNYSWIVQNAMVLVEKKYGFYCDGLPHHNIDAYLKSNCQQVVEQVFKSELEVLRSNHLRCQNDIQRIVFSYVALAEKKGHLHYTSEKDSFLLMIHKKNHYEKFEKHNPTFFCMNDSQYAKDSDREYAKEFLSKLFPKKSDFEL